MARDFVGGDLRIARAKARRLDLWSVLHDKGSGLHLHVQGVPPGDLPGWWVAKFGELNA
jgi:hypothetical protein